MKLALLSSMASTPRSYILEDHSFFHVTWQCHNQDWLLKDNWAKQLYYDLLLRYKDRYGVRIHSYCFMDNHPHLAGQLTDLDAFSDFFRTVNSCLAKAINKKLGRKGQVVMDRFKSPRIQTDAHLLTVMTYIDLNPIRAGKVPHPKQNRFSSYRFYAYGDSDPLITPAPSYLALGSSPQKRKETYRDLVELILQNDWRKKRPFSSVSFIGNPDWVIQKSQHLAQISQARDRDRKQRFQSRFG